MVLGKLPVLGRPTIWITVGQGPTALAVGAGGGCLDIFSLIYPFFSLSPSLWETARYRLKYCLKGPLNPKSTNQPTNRLGVLSLPRKSVVRLTDRRGMILEVYSGRKTTIQQYNQEPLNPKRPTNPCPTIILSLIKQSSKICEVIHIIYS